MGEPVSRVWCSRPGCTRIAGFAGQHFSGVHCEYYTPVWYWAQGSR
jgi:hypothetical protein